jgi:hypothetical protein
VYLSPIKLLLWKWNGFLWRKKGKMRKAKAILTTRLQMLGERRGSEMGGVSMFLFLDME